MASKETKQRYVVRVYTADRRAEMQKLIKALTEVLQANYCADGAIEFVDVLEDPQKAVEQNVFATPAIVREMPEPMRRVIGDLSDPTKVLFLLGLVREEEPVPKD